MATLFPGIDDKLRAFITRQKLFFVATAPLSEEGHVNLSPKGLDTFAVLDDHTIGYLDLTGSGVETISHLRENGRIVLMFCAFEGPPRIVRLQGRGEAIGPGLPEFKTLVGKFPPLEGVRAVIRVSLTRISDSCGYGVPLYEFVGERTQLRAWAQRKGPEALAGYRAETNLQSIDGLPGLDP